MAGISACACRMPGTLQFNVEPSVARTPDTGSDGRVTPGRLLSPTGSCVSTSFSTPHTSGGVTVASTPVMPATAFTYEPLCDTSVACLNNSIVTTLASFGEIDARTLFTADAAEPTSAETWSTVAPTSRPPRLIPPTLMFPIVPVVVAEELLTESAAVASDPT